MRWCLWKDLSSVSRHNSFKHVFFFIEVQLIYNILLISAYSKVIQLHTHMYINKHMCSFLYSFALWFTWRYWIYFPVLYRRTLMFTHSVYTILHLLIPNSQSIPRSPPSPLATTKERPVCTLSESGDFLWFTWDGSAAFHSKDLHFSTRVYYFLPLSSTCATWIVR